MPAGNAALVRHSLLRILPMLAVFLFVICYRVYAIAQYGLIDSRMWVMGVVFVVYAIGAGVYRAFRNQKNVTDHFLLIIEADAVSATQYGLLDVDLSYLEITEIGIKTDGTLVIRGGINNQIISIPPYVEQRQVLIETLARIMPITHASQPRDVFSRYRWAGFLVFIGLIMSMYISRIKAVTGVSGCLLIALCIIIFVRVQTNKVIAPATRRQSWLMMIAVILVILWSLQEVWGFRLTW